MRILRSVTFIVVLGVLISLGMILAQVIFAEREQSEKAENAYEDIRSVKYVNDSSGKDSSVKETMPEYTADDLGEALAKSEQPDKKKKSPKKEKESSDETSSDADSVDYGSADEDMADDGSQESTDSTIYGTCVSAEALGISLSPVDFSALREVGPNVAGWIYIEGTNIDYPVLKGEDNEFYLHHMYDDSYSNNGSIFMDMRNSRDYTDRNTVLYGHHMQNGSMFANLVLYKEQEFYDTHPYAILYTPEGNYLIQLFCGYIKQEEGLPTEFGSDDEFMAYVQNGIDRSTFASNVTVSSTDRIITLSTCSYEFDDARYAVIGRLIRLI